MLVLAAPAVTGASGRTSALRIDRVTQLTFVGHGYGSGKGMGQWGAFGYAVRYHFGYERILDHYYGQTVPATLTSMGRVLDPVLKVVILENVDLTTNVGYDTVITSASPYTLTSIPTGPTTGPAVTPTSSASTPTSGSTAPSSPTTSTSVSSTTSSTAASAPSSTVASSAAASAPALSVPAGEAVDLRLQQNGTWSVYEAATCAAASAAPASVSPVVTGLVDPVATPSTTDASPTASPLLTLCRHDGVDLALRGSIEAYDRSGYERTLNLLPLESYLNGVVPAESTASWGLDGGSVGAPQGEPWGFQALEAQAVAARSYALAYATAGGWNGYADICDTSLCQIYAGANYETPITDQAVTDTLGEVRATAPGSSAVASTVYSASTGGFTAPSAFPPVADRGDVCVVPGVALECNPNHTWRVALPAAALLRHFPKIGVLLSVHVTARNGDGVQGGRTLEVAIRGRRGSVVVSGTMLSEMLGLRSDWFTVARLTRAGGVASPAATGATGTVVTAAARP